MFINMILKVKGPQATCLLHPFYQLFQKSPLSLCNPLRRSKMPSTKAEVVLPSILFSRNHLSSNRRLHWFIYGFIWTTGSPPKRFEKKRHVQVMEPRGPVVIDSSIHWPLKTWNVKKTTQQVAHQSNQKDPKNSPTSFYKINIPFFFLRSYMHLFTSALDGPVP